MRNIQSYHAQFSVRRGKDNFVVTANLSDWMDDLEFLKTAARKIGARTVGQVIESLVGRQCSSIGCHSLTVDKASDNSGEFFDWDMSLSWKRILVLLELLHHWLASWVYLYLAASSHSSKTLRSIFWLCFSVYLLIHISLMLILLAFVVHPVCLS